jgi:hypothetical protein
MFLTLFQNSSFREAAVCDAKHLIVKLTKWTELPHLFVTKTGRNTNKYNIRKDMSRYLESALTQQGSQFADCIKMPTVFKTKLISF